MERARPKGVTIVAILMIINGIVLVGLGVIAALFLSAILALNEPSGFAVALLGLLAVSIVIIILGIASFVVSWGLFKGKPWAWKVTIVLAIVSVVVSIISIVGGNPSSIISLIINGVILYYMYRTEVRTYFGKVLTPK